MGTAVVRFLACASAMLSASQICWAEGERNVALYEECYDSTCPIFQVAIKHRDVGPSAIPSGRVINTAECTKTAEVPAAVFNAVKAVMNSVENGIQRNGGSMPALTPLQQTMLLFYTTIMQQTLNFDCPFKSVATPTPLEKKVDDTIPPKKTK